MNLVGKFCLRGSELTIQLEPWTPDRLGQLIERPLSALEGSFQLRSPQLPSLFGCHWKAYCAFCIVQESSSSRRKIKPEDSPRCLLLASGSSSRLRKHKFTHNTMRLCVPLSVCRAMCFVLGSGGSPSCSVYRKQCYSLVVSSAKLCSVNAVLLSHLSSFEPVLE